MMIARMLGLLVIASMAASLLLSWFLTMGFNPADKRWWVWAGQHIKQTGTLPPEMVMAVYAVGFGGLFLLTLILIIAKRASSTTIHGGRRSKDTHGTARWATKRDVKAAGLFATEGVVVGGFKKGLLGSTTLLQHDGPEHILAFAPTGTGKGVGLVLPTLLSWKESVLVLDIKGENYALTAGWRKSIGQRVLRFDPASLEGSVKYNPLAEIRIETDHEIADCQNIASMIIDPDGKGLKDYWQQSGWEWLAASILHVLYYIRKTEKRTATLADVHRFMSIGHDNDTQGMTGDEGFDQLCDDMAAFNHGRESVDEEVKRSAGAMKKKASQERSGVHSSAKVQLALYSDPIVSKNISDCDFRISDLMNGDKPTSLYIVIPPSDIDRLKPLIRILMNQFLTRLTSEMEFEGGSSVKHYKHRLLLMLDEFTSIGKLEIFERALAYMRGYGLKAYIIVQDLTQLQKAYSKEEAITSNCGIRIAYAPNKPETAKLLSDMTGKTTIVQRKQSNSWSKGSIGGSASQSLSEISRPLMTPDECSALPGLQKSPNGTVTDAGDMLIFVAGRYPIYGRQFLYFQNKEMLKKAKIAPPK
ncbi:type IV secretory system conjugative DNA transfer family protein [Kiloniella laminariae]|uniref:type IV secretory system conjugative DNA transfer family protein n=1 Tax=Kiloniella laminariae TaxID=454162 RepID=UPI000371EAD9|nr:type IV secretory system conjugative DNA transfer family protein [Kiloniella laminariae]